MGNEIDLDKNKDTILWIDSKVKNTTNKETKKIYLQKLKNFNFICLILYVFHQSKELYIL